MLEPRIQQHFFESADLSYQAAEAMARPIADAAQAIVDCVTSGGRVWVHGRGIAQQLRRRCRGASSASGPAWPR